MTKSVFLDTDELIFAPKRSSFFFMSPRLTLIVPVRTIVLFLKLFCFVILVLYLSQIINMKNVLIYLNSVNYLLGSLFTNATGLLSEDSIVNKDFMEKLKDIDDKKQLNKAVTEMRRNNLSKKSIVLKNNETVTILVK